MWTFEKFFGEVTNLLNKKKVFVYFMNKLASLRVYLDKTQHLEDFQLLLTEQTDVEPGSQILLLEDSLLNKQVESNTPGTSFPDTSDGNPIIMFAKNNNGVKFGDERELATFPTLPNLVSVENDATLAKSATAVGYAHKRKIEQYTKCARIMGMAVKQLVEVRNCSIYSFSMNQLLINCNEFTKVLAPTNFLLLALKTLSCQILMIVVKHSFPCR